MPGHKYTKSQFALQQVVETFGNRLHSLAEHHLTHTDGVVFRFCKLGGIDFLVLRYLNPGAVPFEECSEGWLFDGEN